ncbi:hypothetical protein IT575_14920 [bacterium]|nr:hypothetical protein [bacterium]
MTEHDKHDLDQRAAEAAGHHQIGHLADGEPITDSDINYGALWFITIVGSLLTIAIIYVLLGLYGRSLSNEQFAKRIGKNYEINWQQFGDLRTAQLAELGEESRWTNPDKNLVSIPMSEAVKQTLIEAQQKQAAQLQAESSQAAAATEASAAAAASAEAAADEATGEAASAATEAPAATDASAEKEGI